MKFLQRYISRRSRQVVLPTAALFAVLLAPVAVGQERQQVPVNRLRLSPAEAPVQDQIEGQIEAQTPSQAPRQVLRFGPKRPPLVWQPIALFPAASVPAFRALELVGPSLEPVVLSQFRVPKVWEPVVDLEHPLFADSDVLELESWAVPVVEIPRIRILSIMEPSVPLLEYAGPEFSPLAAEEFSVEAIAIPKLRAPRVWEPMVAIGVPTGAAGRSFEALEYQPIVTPSLAAIPEVDPQHFYILAWPDEYRRLADSASLAALARKPLRVLGVTLPHVEFKKRMDRGIIDYLFVPKGSGLVGVQLSFWDEQLQDYDLFQLLQDWDMGFRSLSVAPYGAYVLRDNMAVGGSFRYRNNSVRIDNLDLEFGDDFSLDLRDVRLSEKLYTATVFTRFFVGLGPFRRIGLFSDVEFAYTWGSGQLFSGRNEPPVDVHQHIAGWNLGMRPGLVAFVTNNLSFEASLGLLGFQYRQTKLYEGGHIVGSRQTSKANFRADLLSLSLGLSLYLY